MNKKILGIVGALAIAAVSGVSCAKSETYVYFGLGNSVVANQKGTAPAAKTVQADASFAAVLFDQDGKIIDANIDVMQASVKSTTLTSIETNAPTKMNAVGDFKSKWELGDSYGMKTASAISKEWYEQMNAYENWTVGKTIADIKGAGYKVANGTHLLVPTNAALLTSVSITTQDYLNNIEKAWNNRVAVKVAKVADVKLGLGSVSGITSTTTKWEVAITVAAALFGKDNKVLAARHDVHQVPLVIAQRDVTEPAPATYFDVSIKEAQKQLAPGATAASAQILSKHDLGPVYNMYYKPSTTTSAANTPTIFFNGKVYERKGTTGAGEWYEQANSIVGYLVGKTVAAVAAGVSATTFKFNDGVLASVTITVDDYVAAYEEAFEVAGSATR